MNTYYIISGGFDPIYEGHIDMGLVAVKKSDGVIVLVSPNTWLVRKKAKGFNSTIS